MARDEVNELKKLVNLSKGKNQLAYYAVAVNKFFYKLPKRELSNLNLICISIEWVCRMSVNFNFLLNASIKINLKKLQVIKFTPPDKMKRISDDFKIIMHYLPGNLRRREKSYKSVWDFFIEHYKIAKCE